MRKGTNGHQTSPNFILCSRQALLNFGKTKWDQRQKTRECGTNAGQMFAIHHSDPHYNWLLCLFSFLPLKNPHQPLTQTGRQSWLSLWGDSSDSKLNGFLWLSGIIGVLSHPCLTCFSLFCKIPGGPVSSIPAMEACCCLLCLDQRVQERVWQCASLDLQKWLLEHQVRQ